MKKGNLEEQLKSFVPTGGENYLAYWIRKYQIHFHVSADRKTKLGDFRPAWNNKPARISVNGGLNPYAFWLTSLHELAHYLTWNKFENKVKPHGKEWKIAFQWLWKQTHKNVHIPEDIESAYQNYLQNPAASSCSSPALIKALARYDENTLPFLDDLPQGARFELNGNIYVRMEKRRTRIRCLRESNQKFYLVSQIAQVQPI